MHIYMGKYYTNAKTYTFIYSTILLMHKQVTYINKYIFL